MTTTMELLTQCKVFLANISYLASEAQLKEFLERRGHAPVRFNIAREATGRSKGYAFLEYATPAAAEAAIGFLQGQVFNGRPLAAAYARRKDGNR